MTTPAAVTPTLLTDPGFLLWAPVGSTAPSGTVTGSVLTDTWDVAWVNLGATEDGSEFSTSTSVEAMRVAEFLDPVRYASTERESSFAFALANYTAANLKKVLNGGTLTTTGTGATTKNVYTPPVLGAEVRCMIGWQSLDATVRLVCHQVINSGDITMAFKKVPDYTTLPCTFQLETPSTGIPYTFTTAGASR